MVKFGDAQLSPYSHPLAGEKPFDRIDLSSLTPIRNSNHPDVLAITHAVSEAYPDVTIRRSIGIAGVALEITPPTYGRHFESREAHVLTIAKHALAKDQL